MASDSIQQLEMISIAQNAGLIIIFVSNILSRFMNLVIQKKMNAFGKAKIPFLFIISFDTKKGNVIPLSKLNSENFLYKFPNQSTKSRENHPKNTIQLQTKPISFELYQKKYDKVLNHIKRGDSFLTNLTCKTPIKTDSTLEEIFHSARAKYKLFWKDHFVCFSPETFVKTQNNEIYSYPMKGTIDAKTPNAREKILQDKKEKAEHATIVDLIRNDLSQISNQVKVKKYRYITEIKSNQRTLLQVSSEIQGNLSQNWSESIGDLLQKLLPAGSISGAPKAKTLEIIKESEQDNRGFYSGVFGVFDGKNLDSAVSIRLIQKSSEKLFYHSGGGITHWSNAKEEYDEMLKKVYVPIH